MANHWYFSLQETISVSLILFAIIDILGSIPIIINLQEKSGKIRAWNTTLVSGGIMLLFMFVGEPILHIFGVDVESFALAGSLVIFFLALEMILGIVLFKEDPQEQTSSIVPLAFPLIAGAGSLTTILSLQSQYSQLNIMLGILLNLLFVFIVLKATPFIHKKLGKGGTAVLRRVFGIILLAIAIKLFKSNLGFVI